MKLWIKDEYFDEIRDGKKTLEFRDAHITFVAETTKRKLRKDVKGVMMVPLNFTPRKYRHLFTDKQIIVFKLK